MGSSVEQIFEATDLSVEEIEIYIKPLIRKPFEKAFTN